MKLHLPFLQQHKPPTTPLDERAETQKRKSETVLKDRDRVLEELRRVERTARHS